MMKVVFKNSEVVKFDADSWNFSDITSKNVYLVKDGNVIAHLNWSEVLYIENEKYLIEKEENK